MTNPRRYLARMLIFLAIVAAVAGMLFAPLFRAFMANPAFNGMILAVLLVGIGFLLRQMLQLRPEVSWIETYRTSRPGLSVQQPPAMLAPVATMLGERRDQGLSLSAPALRSLLDSISSRLAESRDISRYVISLLIFLGLLGTFWGLLRTIGAVSAVIAGLSIETGNLGEVFADLKTGLESPLSGMATAFSSSLFGLAGSLVLGFLDLQLGQAQNRFYNDLEEWLSGLTRLGSAGLGDGEGRLPPGAYQAALSAQTAENLDRLQRVIHRNEEDRRATHASLTELSERLATLTEQMRIERELMQRMGEAQLELKPILTRLADSTLERDDLARTHLRNIEASLIRLVADNAAGRAETLDELRHELRLVARTIAALADEERIE